MSQALRQFLMVDDRFFDNLSQYTLQADYEETTRSFLPASWDLLHDGVWLKAKPPAEVQIPLQGFKIHISVLPRDADAILDLAVPLCLEHGVNFKHIADSELHGFSVSKDFGRTASGKFFVIYPKSRENFENLLEILHDETRHLEGPHVLSDRPYRESRVLFYRFGGFQMRTALQVDGTRKALIADPNGNPREDVRTPYFSLPPWVQDPFPETDTEEGEDDDSLLNGRYEVKTSLKFSNSGGVYLADDRETGRECVLKEARPMTNVFGRPDGSTGDAVDLLHNEYGALRALADVPGVVSPIELFQEWQHSFLVEEKVDGIPLLNYRARDDFSLIPYERNLDKLESFSRNFRWIALQMIVTLEAIHAAGVVLGDLSTSNIMVDPESSKLWFIDLEAAVHAESEEHLETIASRWVTPGFRDIESARTGVLEANDDLKTLGRVLLSLFTTTTTIVDLAPEVEDRVLEKIRAAVLLPDEVLDSIEALNRGDAAAAREILECWDVEASIAAARAVDEPEPTWRRDDDELRDTVRSLGEAIIASTSPDRGDRLWPGDIAQFQQDPMAVAHGATGVALFLKATRGELPEEARKWMSEYPLDARRTPPGLYTGLSGIAFALHQLGETERGLEALEVARQSPLLGQDPSFYQGDSGYGWANLYFHRVSDAREDADEHLEHAIRAGDQLLLASTLDDGLRSWPREDGTVPHGLAHGAAGVALFLGRLAEASGLERFGVAARQALRFEEVHAIQLDDGAISWGRNRGDNLAMPYWEYGSAGVATAALAVHDALGGSDGEASELLSLARAAADNSFSRFAINVEQMSGLAGIGETMLDMARATGESVWLERAHDIADSIMRYRVVGDEGTMFPGRRLLRLSHDYGTGGAGVGSFLQRLLSQGPRMLHDLDWSCDAVSSSGPAATESSLPSLVEVA